MRKQWQRVLSVLLCVLLAGALVPPVAAATVAGEVAKVVLEPEKDEHFWSQGEVLIVCDTVYTVDGSGSIQKKNTGLFPNGYYFYRNSYLYGYTADHKFAVWNAATGDFVWQETDDKAYKYYDNGCIVYQTGPDTYGLYGFDTGKDYPFPIGLLDGLEWAANGVGGYGEGKLTILDESSGNYFYFDLETGQNAFPGQEFALADPFSAGYARVVREYTSGSESLLREEVIDSSGQIVGADPYPCGFIGGKMSEGLFLLLDDDGHGWGYVDHTGTVVVPCQYTDAEPFHNGYARVGQYSSVAGKVYGLIERSTGNFIDFGTMKILTDASPAGTVWAATDWDDPDTAYLVNIAEMKNSKIISLDAVKYVPYSELVVEQGAVAETEGLPDWLTIENGVLSGVPAETGEYSFSLYVDNGAALDKHNYKLTVADNANQAVDASVSDGYEIETYIPDTVTGEQDQLFTIDDTETSDAGSNYERFQDVYLDGVKLKGGKVSDPAQAGADWDYYATEGSTKITVYSKTFQNKPEGKHTISATFQSIGGTSGKVDTVSQNFEIKRPAQPSSPQPTTSGPVKVGDVVNFTGSVHYTTSYDAAGWKCLPGQAVVTRIFEKGKHQYHLIATEGSNSTVYGWVNGADISAPAASETPANPVGQGIVKGAKVMVNTGAKTYTGATLSKFVYSTTYTVLEVKGDRVVIGLNGVTTAAMNIRDLTLAG